MANNKSVLTLTLASFVPIMRLPSLEDLCIFDIKFFLSSRLLCCWLFLTRRPCSPNFPIFNREPAASPPQPLLLHHSWMLCGFFCWHVLFALFLNFSALPCPHPVLWTLRNNLSQTYRVSSLGCCRLPRLWETRSAAHGYSIIIWSAWWTVGSWEEMFSWMSPDPRGSNPHYTIFTSVTFRKPHPSCADAGWRTSMYLWHIRGPCCLDKLPSGCPAC